MWFDGLRRTCIAGGVASDSTTCPAGTDRTTFEGPVMRRILPTLPWVIGGIAFVAVAVLALYYVNDWWLSGVVTASILAWLAGVLAAIYSRPRAFVVGAVIAGFLYV